MEKLPASASPSQNNRDSRYPSLGKNKVVTAGGRLQVEWSRCVTDAFGGCRLPEAGRFAASFLSPRCAYLAVLNGTRNAERLMLRGRRWLEFREYGGIWWVW